MTVNGDLKKEHFRGRTLEDHERHLSGWSVCRLGVEVGASRVRNMNVVHCTVTFGGEA